MKDYDHTKIEKKWQKEWDKSGIYEADDKSTKPKFYALIEFPYPSGDGLHVGHVRSNTAMDIISRKRRMGGANVLYPIGWDAFGLPTENYAIKTGIQPAVVTKTNTDNFRKQLKSLGFGFDWSREINTTDPAYYKWTQWIFLKFLEAGLAYKKKMVINWCPKDKIGLANEEVIDGKCERCGTPVEKREKEQWMLAITKYADRLDRDLDTVDYLEKIKIQQRNWIGRSEGAEVDFKIKIDQKNTEEKIKVFTTRLDTIFGMTYLVLAPEHPFASACITRNALKNTSAIKTYREQAKNKTEIERSAEGKEKTGVMLEGVVAINPASGEEIPIFVADYVLGGYGTGAIMAVPAHDERDMAFAKQFKLPVKIVVEPKFVGTAGEGAVVPGLEFVKRNAVCVIVRNPKDDTYLCISWKGLHMHGLVTGGIDTGEDIVEAARREILEETGYKNLKFIKTSPLAINTYFYQRVKKQNRHAHFQFVFFDLENDERAAVDEKEASLHEVVWKKKGELKEFFSVFEGHFLVDLLNKPDYMFTGEGLLTNSANFDGLDSADAKNKIAAALGAKIVTNYKLRDWVFSRQRYWGEPIPVVHCAKCGIVPLPEKDLPLELPKVKNYQPTDTGESPLAVIDKWVNTKCRRCKGPAKRETDTMPNWAGSSWYYLRYTDPHNKKAFASAENLKHWTPVDWYNGGMEHTTLHLLYSRFWHKFLFDLKLVPTSEPYQKRTSQGLILAADGEKISKSKGNGVKPDEIVATTGADSLRLYEMFIGPFDQPAPWSNDGIVGVRRFIERVWKLQEDVSTSEPLLRQPEILMNKTIKKVTEDIEAMRFNTAISTLMIYASELKELNLVPAIAYQNLLLLLAPFAPHVTEELWETFGSQKGSIHLAPWPQFDPSKIADDTKKIAVQVNGKTRGMFEVGSAIFEGLSDKDIENMAVTLPEVKKWLDGKTIKKVIVIKGKMVSIVVV